MTGKGTIQSLPSSGVFSYSMTEHWLDDFKGYYQTGYQFTHTDGGFIPVTSTFP